MKNVNKTKTKYIIPLAGILIIFIIGFMVVRGRSSKSSTTTVASANESYEVSDARKTTELNREFEFPILDELGNEVSKMRYIIEKAELRDEIIVKGSKATSVPGRVFLVLTIKINNDLDKGVEINTRDYIRLSIDDSNERLAFNIHNDPVEVDAISTKPTRLALPINDDYQKLTLYVGEITGEKEQVDLTF